MSALHITTGVAPDGFYRTDAAGVLVCALCAEPRPAHTPACPVIALRAQLRELTVQLGLLVATMRETIDAQDALLRGGAADEGAE